MDDVPYTVRVSARARRVALRVMPHGAVEVVLPHGVNSSLVPDYLTRNRDWILRTRARMRAASRVPPEQNGPRPALIELAAIRQVWRISYDSTLARAVCQPAEQCLRLPVDTDERTTERLRRWLHGQAVARLEPWLRDLASQHGFVVNRVAVRAQKSRWGSCSSKGNINLNSRLMFLSPEIVRYLLLHELCHTVHLNHSPAYWHLVGQVEPQWKQLNARLREGFRDVPLWAYPSYP
jgi:predicted metal-dependent hydrolase